MNEQKSERSYPFEAVAEKRGESGMRAQRQYPFEQKAERSDPFEAAEKRTRTGNAAEAPKKPAGKGRRGGNSSMSFVIKAKKPESEGKASFGTQMPAVTEAEFSEAKRLTVSRNTEIGSFLELKEDSLVLLPFAEQTHKPEVGEQIEVYLYTDKGGRLTATMRKPILKTGEVGLLKVAELTRIGAFLDNGVPKQVLVPFKEQICTPKEGSDVLVYLYTDKSGRQAATMRVYKHLESHAPYEADDRVSGFIYEINPQIGAFVAVDNRYFGLIPRAEMFEPYHYGQVVSCRVLKVREDGKLDLSPREKAYIAIPKDADAVLSELRREGGKLPYADKAPAELIESVYGMSKNQFKRAVGHLYHRRLIEIDREADTITLIGE